MELLVVLAVLANVGGFFLICWWISEWINHSGFPRCSNCGKALCPVCHKNCEG